MIEDILEKYNMNYENQSYTLLPSLNGSDEVFYIPFLTDKNTLMELYYGINHADGVFILRDNFNQDSFVVKFIFYKDNSYLKGMYSIIMQYKKYGYYIQNINVQDLLCYFVSDKKFNKLYKEEYGEINYNNLIVAYKKIKETAVFKNNIEIVNYLKLLIPQSIDNRLEESFKIDKKIIEENKNNFNNEFKTKNSIDSLSNSFLEFPLLELNDNDKVLINSKKIDGNNIKVKEKSNDNNYSNLFPIILFSITAIIIIFIICVSISDNSGDTKSSKNNNSNITDDYNTTNNSYEIKAYKNANYIANAVYNNASGLNDNYTVLDATPTGAKLESHYFSENDDNKTIFVLRFNNNEELTEIFVTYDKNNKKYSEDVFKILTSNFFELSEVDKNNIKDIINSNEEEIEKEINNFKIKKYNRNNLSYNAIYFDVIDTSKFANIVK